VQDLFGGDTHVLLYDLTSTYFEREAEGVERAVHGYGRDHRPDCQQVMLALVVTTDGLPLTYQSFSRNTHDASTLQVIITASRRPVWPGQSAVGDLIAA
jgi:transposase